MMLRQALGFNYSSSSTACKELTPAFPRFLYV